MMHKRPLLKVYLLQIIMMLVLLSFNSCVNICKNVFIGNNSKDIDIYWENNSNLVILHNSIEKDIFAKIYKYENIEIKYLLYIENNYMEIK